MTTATLTPAERKVARLNSILAVLREWQRGAIAWSAVQHRADLTDAEMVPLADIYRTIGKADLARIVAGIVGL